MNMDIGIQLYTVRDELQKDFLGTIRKIAEIGYKGVEFAGFYDTPAQDVKKVLDETGLVSYASHTGMELLRDQLDKVLEYNSILGTKFIVCPYGKFETRKAYEEAAEFFNRIGQTIKKAGFEFCYHNHAHEFEKIDDLYGLDLLYELTDAELLKAQIDVYWVKYAGVDPVEYIQKYNGRCPIVHLKDMDNTEEKGLTEVGNGMIDMKKIIETGLKCGVRYFSVEQDTCQRPSLESAKISFDNLKAI